MADVTSGLFVAVGIRRVATRLEQKTVPLMGVLSAFVFAVQMINLHIAGGTSAHLLGGVLVSALLGPWAGLILMTIVLISQHILFQDGGLAAMGCNIFDMGVVGSMGGWLLFQLFRRIFSGRRALFWSAFWASWLGVLLSSLSCAFFLVVSHVVSWHLALTFIVGIHALLGIGEGLVTGGALQTIALRRPDLLPKDIS